MFISFCFCGPIFVRKYHVRACCCRASLIPGIAAPQALHCTSQTARNAESQVRAHQRATTLASRQSWRASILSSIYTARWGLKTKKCQTAYSENPYNYTHIASVMPQVFALASILLIVQCNSAPSVRTSQVLIVHACGVRVVLEERGLVICKSSPRT